MSQTNINDLNVLKEFIKDALTSDPSVHGEVHCSIASAAIWNTVNVFKSHAVVLYFTGRLPKCADLAQAIDAGFGHLAVDKIFLLVKAFLK